MFNFVVRVVVFGFFAVLAGGQQLQIRPDQVSHTKAIGTAILFTCEAKNTSDNDKVDIKWIDNANREIMEKNGRLYIEDDTKLVRKLYITSIQEADAGKYTCQAMIGGTELEKHVFLEIFRDITFGDFPQEQHPKIHTDALISCVVDGQPVPLVSWRHMGNRLKEGKRYSITSAGLVVRNITESDNGEYTCRGEVESDGRYNERKISVAVHIPPKITKAPGDVEVEQGARVFLACEADGLPKPEYEFYKDGGSVPLEGSKNTEISELDGTIQFKSVKKEDEGSYTCNATNRVGSDTGVGKLKVLVEPTITQFHDVVAEQGKEVNVICVSEGDPQPTMMIYKEGATEVHHPNSSEDTRVTVSSSQPGGLHLTIHNLSIEDAGCYICNASNKVGTNAKNATVMVHFKPRFTEVRKEVYNWVGKAQNLTCEPLSEPASRVEWVHGKDVLVNNDNFDIYTLERSSVLQVTVREVDQSWIYGDYICRAANYYGEAESIIEMKRATAPNMPLNVNFVQCMPTAIVLEVEPPEDDGGVTISGYNVEYRERIQDVITAADEGSAEANETEVQVTTYTMITAETVDSTDGNIRVENLKANTTYIFTVRARNEVGLGNPYVYSATTDTFKKPQPIIINSVNMSKHPFEYTVTWQKPETGGKPIQQYKFSIRKVSFNKDMQKVEEVPESSWSEQIVQDSSHILSHTHKDLSPNTHYQLKIRAANEIGWSEPTNEFLFSTSEDPNASPPSTPDEESTAGPMVAMTTSGKDGDEEGEEDSTEAEASSQQAQAGTGLVIGIVLAVFIIFLIIVDVSCYFLNSCGLTMFLCGKLCKKEAHYAKDKAMEEGEREHLNKPTAPEEKNEDLKEPLKDEIPLEHPKAFENEDTDVTKKPETTVIV